MATPTTFGTSRLGMVDDSTVTGLLASSGAWTSTADKAQGKDHVGSTVALGLIDDRCTTTMSGVIKTAGSGLTPALGDVLALANESADSLNLNEDQLFSTAVGTAGAIVTSCTVSRTNSDFETGDLDLEYYPMLATS